MFDRDALSIVDKTGFIPHGVEFDPDIARPCVNRVLQILSNERLCFVPIESAEDFQNALQINNGALRTDYRDLLELESPFGG